MNAKEILKQYFKYDYFRDNQEKIINSIIIGHDCLVLMPTGSGKSICYQIPAMLFPGITIVISPLISLMQDQITSLTLLGIKATCINSFLSGKEQEKILKEIELGYYKLIYISPERLHDNRFTSLAQRITISMITIDEAHCVSQWGYDFRPSYIQISKFINNLPERPIVSAFTATATQEIITDIICLLQLQNPQIYASSFNRPNLVFKILRYIAKEKFIIDYILKHKEECGIIYCSTRNNVEKLYNELISHNIKVTKYHAELNHKTRTDNQNEFLSGKSSLIIATNAFGLGINKKDVRFVIHFNMPYCIENYYQEAGRAGRDGKEAECILLFDDKDIQICNYLLANKNYSNIPQNNINLIKNRDKHRLEAIIKLCQTTKCIRNQILEYFGENHSIPCDKCLVCINSKKSKLSRKTPHMISIFSSLILKLILLFLTIFFTFKIILNLFLFHSF